MVRRTGSSKEKKAGELPYIKQGKTIRIRLVSKILSSDLECTRDNGTLLFPNQCSVYSSWVTAPICIGKEHSTQLRDSYIYIKWQVDWTQTKDTRLWEIDPTTEYIRKMIHGLLSCMVFITISLMAVYQQSGMCRLVFS